MIKHGIANNDCKKAFDKGYNYKITYFSILILTTIGFGI